MKINVIKKNIDTICNQLTQLKRERTKLVNKHIGLFPNVEKSKLKNYTHYDADEIIPWASEEQSDILEKISILNIRIIEAKGVLIQIQSLTGSYLLSCIFKY